jgi:hypothetical protein
MIPPQLATERQGTVVWTEKVNTADKASTEVVDYLQYPLDRNLGWHNMDHPKIGDEVDLLAEQYGWL